MTRRRTKTWAIALMALALVLPAVGTAMAQGQSPQYREKTNRYELSNGVVTVWFQGKKPLLRITSSDNASRSYQLHLTKIVEFQDANGDHAFNQSEQVAFLNLNKAKGWNVSVDQSGDSLTFTMHTQGQIQTNGPLGNVTPPVPLPGQNRTANVTLVFHITSSTQEIQTGNNTTTNITSSQVKFDVQVDNWTWTNPQSDQLAIVGNMPMGHNESLNASASQVNVTRNGTQVGGVSWLPTAQITTGNNTTMTDVYPSFQNGSQTGGNGSAMVAWAINGTGYDSFRYDPTMAIQSSSSSGGFLGGNGTGSGLGDQIKNAVPAPGLAIVVGAGLLAAVALAERRRRR